MATGEKILDGTILNSGKGWQIFKPSKGRVQLRWLCLNCHHRIGRHNHRATLGWHHFYQAAPDARYNRHATCWCGCEHAIGPKSTDQTKAYAKLEYWALEIQKERLYGNKQNRN